jgi:hypothetical protein
MPILAHTVWSVPAQDHRKFIAAQSRDRIDVRDTAAQPLRGDAQHLIARGVTDGVIDLLEVVQVDIENGAVLHTRSRALQLRGQAAAEQHPVGQPGQRVEVRLTVQLLVTRALGQGDRQPGGELAAAATDLRVGGRRFLVTHGQDGFQMRRDLDRPYPEELGAQLLQRHQETVASVLAARHGQRFGLGGKRHHHVIVEGHAADRQVPAALGGQVNPTPPRRVMVAQDDAGAAAAGHPLHPGQDGVEHRFQAARLEQQAVDLAQGLQVGVLGTHPLRAVIEGPDQADQVIVPRGGHLGEPGRRQVLEAAAQRQQGGLVATHQVGDGDAGAQQGDPDADREPAPRVADSGAAGHCGDDHQHGYQGTQADGCGNPLHHPAINSCAKHP